VEPLLVRVVDGAGAPRPQAVLRVSMSGGPDWKRGANPLRALLDPDSYSVPAGADAEGRVRLVGLPQGTYRIAAWATPEASWYAEATVDVPRRSAEDFVVVVDDATTLRGVVVNARGEPVPGAEIRPRAQDRDWAPTETDAEGRFVLPGAREGPMHGRWSPERTTWRSGVLRTSEVRSRWRSPRAAERWSCASRSRRR
jgi:hypothetical protein